MPATYNTEWKKLGKEAYSALKKYPDGDRSAAFLLFAVFGTIVGFLYWNNSYNINPIVNITIMAVFGAAIIGLLAAAVIEKIRWKSYSKLLDGSHGEYCYAEIVKKLHREPVPTDNTFYIKVLINGKKRTVMCREDVFKYSECGEKIIVADLTGSKGTRPRFCIALSQLPSASRPGDADFYISRLDEYYKADTETEKHRIIDDMLDDIHSYKEYDHRPEELSPLPYRKGAFSASPLPEDILKDIIRQELRNYFRSLLPCIIFPVVFLAAVFGIPILTFIKTDIILWSSVLTLVFCFLSGGAFVMMFIFALIYAPIASKVRGHIHKLRSGDVVGEELTYIESSFYEYYNYANRRDIRTYKHYYHICRNNKNHRLVVESEYPARCEPEERVIVVFYNNNDARIYKKKTYVN